MAMTSYYTYNGITIYYGDCMEILASLKDVNIIITDPPYLVSKHDANILVHGRTEIQQDFGTWDYQLDIPAFVALCPDIPIITFTGHNLFGQWISEFERKYQHSAFAIWQKPNPAPQFRKRAFVSSVELIAIGGRPVQNFLSQNDMHNCFVGPGDTNKQHPTQKPLWLIKHLITVSTKPGDLILDPFMGSGTTLVAAQILGRSAIGIEREKKYCDVAIQRLQQQSMLMDSAE